MINKRITILLKLTIEEKKISPEEALEYLQIILNAVKKSRNNEQLSVNLEFTTKKNTELILDGWEEDLQCLADLHESGELQTLINDVKPDNVAEIIVKNAEFTGNSLIIEKAQFIKDIREGRKGIREAGVEQKKLLRANLSGANLSNANLSEAILYEAILSGCILNKTNLNRAILNGAILNGANLYEAILSEAILSGANLSGAILSRANLSGAILSRANLSDAILNWVNLSGANLIGANLSRAIFAQAIVKNARFGNNQGISQSLKKYLIKRGAIFVEEESSDNLLKIFTTGLLANFSKFKFTKYLIISLLVFAFVLLLFVIFYK